MQISPVSMFKGYGSNVNFGKKEGKQTSGKTYEQVLNVPEGKKVVMCNWGGNYVYPVIVDKDTDAPCPDCVRTVSSDDRAKTACEVEVKGDKEESYEDYYKRKIGTAEWGAY